MPQSGPARSPAKKLSPIRLTPASRTALTKASTSWSPGVGWSGHGHQNSTAPNPAAAAAAGRCSSGTSENSSEQFAAYLRLWFMIFRSVESRFC